MLDRWTETIPPSVLRDLAEAPELGIVIDLDGTLLPLAATPPRSLDTTARRLLLDLGALPGVQVVIVSGRTRASLSALFPDAEPWIIAEHGAWRRGRGGTFSCPIEGDPASIRRCTTLLEGIARRISGAWVEPKSWAVCFHFRLVPEELRNTMLAEIDAAVLSCLVSAPELERVNGEATVEVRHRSANKGQAIDWVLEELGGGASRLVVFGDDVTDEDAFRVAGPDDVTVHVGGGETHARYRIASPEDVRTVLRALISERLSARTSLAPPPSIHDAPKVEPRLVVASNRLPEAVQESGARKRSVGGLVSALGPALEQRGGGLWIGWSGRAKKGVPLGGHATTFDLDASPMRGALDLAPETVENFYDGFCNRTLWPLLHGFVSRVRFDDDEWRAYGDVNRSFAEAICRAAPPDVPVWVHDYHLFLVGRELRSLGHAGPIGFFLHVPLPSVELMETLPWCEEIFDAMMSFDLIGFHTARYADNYRAGQETVAGARSIGSVLRKGDRASRVGVFPIGISPEPFVRGSEAVLDDEIQSLIRSLGDRRLLLGVDRLDYSKGIPERLRAFQRFLETFPEWRRRVSFVQVSVPSREGLPDYAQQRKLVEELVGRINGEFGDADWVPVRYLYRSYGQEQLARLYRAAAVGIVTPLKDGMNLVAKEFVASQRAGDPGVLLLSRFAGAADELTDAVLTNPFHACGFARDLDRCLRMPLEERLRRHASSFERVMSQTAEAWGSSFIEALEARRNSAADEVECPGHEAA